MHASSLENMRRFISKYMDENASYRILDVGSQEVPGEANGSYRKLFENPLWRYEGADIVPGNNVSVVLEHPYRWKNVKSRSFDCVVCGQMLEHDEFFWLSMLEIARILREGGLCCIIAPSGGPEHRYPVDCYRYYPDGMRAAARYAGLEVLEAYAQWNEELYPNLDRYWRDCVLICRKPALRPLQRVKRSLSAALIQLGSASAADTQYGGDYGQAGVTTWRMPKPELCGSLYMDLGEGYTEANAMHPSVRSGVLFHEKLTPPPHIRHLRFDPVEGYPCLVLNLSVRTQDGLSLGCEPCNGQRLDGNLLLFLDTTDPQIEIALPAGECPGLEISAQIWALWD